MERFEETYFCLYVDWLGSNQYKRFGSAEELLTLEIGSALMVARDVTSVRSVVICILVVWASFELQILSRSIW